MPRFFIAASLLTLTLAAAQAQEAPAAPNITVDPLAIVDAMPQQGMLLTGIYATQATIELCSVTVIEPGTAAMSAHRRQLESELRMDADTAAAAYTAIKGDVEKSGVDCAEGSVDRKQADEVIALYTGSAQTAAPAQPAASPMDPATPATAPATPVAPAQ